MVGDDMGLNRSDRRRLELHRAVVGHIQVDPDRVRELGLANVEAMRSQFRENGWGASGLRWVDKWEELLLGPQSALIEMCLMENELGCDMRQVGPFNRVLSQRERDSVLAELT